MPLMLKRLFVDNYKCLVNFELRFLRHNLLLGLNGTGKTTIFDILGWVGALIRGDTDVGTAFPKSSLTRWQSQDVQVFELEITSQVERHDYLYRLEIEHSERHPEGRIKKERLDCGPVLLFDREYNEAQLYRDDGSIGPQVLSDWRRSSLYQINPRPENKKLTWFKRRMERILLFQPDPWAMAGRSQQESLSLDSDMENFSSWYRHLIQERSREMNQLQEDLRGILGDGFVGIRLATKGEEVRHLVVDWQVGSGEQTVTYDFNELSEGQRVLIGLYTLVRAVTGEDATICLDEPDNFVALKEIQPWLNHLEEQARLQVILISHHPEIIDRYAAGSGHHLRRSAGGAVRVAPFSAPPEEMLTPAQLVARGWEDGAA